jgi:hypothetical protein
MPRERVAKRLRVEVVDRDGRECWLCRRPIALEETVSLDHVQPVIFGGTNDVTNLRPAHAFCIRQRGEWDVDSYYSWALGRGDDHLVPEPLHASLRQEASQRARHARTYYAHVLRGSNRSPLGGAWAHGV